MEKTTKARKYNSPKLMAYNKDLNKTKFAKVEHEILQDKYLFLRIKNSSDYDQEIKVLDTSHKNNSMVHIYTPVRESSYPIILAELNAGYKYFLKGCILYNFAPEWFQIRIIKTYQKQGRYPSTVGENLTFLKNKKAAAYRCFGGDAYIDSVTTLLLNLPANTFIDLIINPIRRVVNTRVGKRNYKKLNGNTT